jgi:ATP-dependent DNA helicase DinG
VSQEKSIALPDVPALVVGVKTCVWLTSDGEVETLTLADAARRLPGNLGAAPMVCHRASCGRRLRTGSFSGFDVLELFAFVRPARFCLPTVRGIAESLGLPLPQSLEQEAETLFAVAVTLLQELADPDRPQGADAGPVAQAMSRGGWPWGPAVLAALGTTEAPKDRNPTRGFKVWERLKDWGDVQHEEPLGNWPVESVEARARLVQLLGAKSEERPQQVDYASNVIAAFAPLEHEGVPHMVLAEAGTGVGKTLGYIAPASVWAEKNDGAVWVSTFTRNLQRQLDAELDRLYPNPSEKAQKVVIRKGRENYLCLLNFEEAVSRLPLGGTEEAVALGLMARWLRHTRDGDMVGGDFPAWIADLLGRGSTVELTDTRGECVYSSCTHYRKCFIEKSVRRARRANIVVANHALVMVQAVLHGGIDGALPTRYVFDEGHHLFSAADAAFSTHLTGQEGAELRRWLVGVEEGSRSRSRARGLKARIDDLIVDDLKADEMLDEVLRAARVLPSPGWRQRLADARPDGAAEHFFQYIHQQVYARAGGKDAPYSIETTTQPCVDGLLDAADGLEAALARLAKPLAELRKILSTQLGSEASDLDSSQRLRIEAVVRSLGRRGTQQVQAWLSMLKSLHQETPNEFVDWFGVERIDGRDFDVGLHRHWVDPTQPFAEVVAEPAHGILITSASLRGSTGDDDADWAAAMGRTSVNHLPSEPVMWETPSPFDYAANTRVLVVGDVNKNSADDVSAAYRELFIAAGGGGLGLFTAIHRLRAVHKRIESALDDAGLPLLAQHVDRLDTGSLVDIFRAEENACLLGTDAVRDGVDVPGRSLRLIVFDRVPWPRPDILHKSRRKASGGRGFDEMLTRLKLKQAFGRLVRRADDRGIFVLLDRAMPSRLASAFPEGVELERIGLKEAIAETRAFVNNKVE